MTTNHTMTANGGADGKMTIADLRGFLAAIPQTADNNNALLKVRTTMGGHVKSVSVTIQAVYEPREED